MEGVVEPESADPDMPYPIEEEKDMLSQHQEEEEEKSDSEDEFGGDQQQECSTILVFIIRNFNSKSQTIKFSWKQEMRN